MRKGSSEKCCDKGEKPIGGIKNNWMCFQFDKVIIILKITAKNECLVCVVQ